MRKWFVAATAVFACLVLLSSSAYAQNAQVNGTVRDTSGAIVPGATVSAKN